MFFRLAVINGNLSRESCGQIEHELNHMLQNSFGQKKNETLYDKIVDQIRNGEQFYKQVGYALYLTFNTEISSFAIQYYSFLKNNNIPLEDVYKYFPDDEGNPYGEFLFYYNFVMNNKNKINDLDVKKNFGISKNELINRLNNAQKRYKTKMIKALIKYKNELQESYFQNLPKKANFSKTNKIRRMTFLLECYQKGIYKEESEF